MKKDDKQDRLDHFSLGIGGPFYKLFEKLGLLKKPLLLYKRRIIIFSLITWLPLLLLSALDGTAFGGVKLSFMHDIEVHVRFLLVLSMLIYAEVIAHDRLYVIVQQFLKCNIIATEDRKKFDKIIASATRFRDSVLVEIALIIMVYTVGHWVSKEYLPLSISSWFSGESNDAAKLTPAGYWYIFISLPIFQFILLRWYFRIVVWYRFLWQISRLPLQLNSLHPDKAGGLGFLSNSIYALEPFLLAHSILLSGMILNRIWNAGSVVFDFQMEIIGILIFILMIPLVPLLFFIFKLVKEKRMGTLRYDVVANQYVNDFRQKWITNFSKNSSSLLGSSDIQSLADLFNSFEVSNRMRITPFDRSNVMTLIIITLLPLLPLLLTIIPMEKIISQLFGMIF